MTSRRYRSLAFWILAVGFALRLAWALVVPVSPTSDGIAYDELAWNLATRGAYVWNAGTITAYWPVGTSFIYSLLFRLFGHVYWPIALLNLGVGTATLALIMALGRRWIGDCGGLGAGLLYAFWPAQIEFTSVLAAELLFNLFVLLALWTALEARIRALAVRALLTGLLLAAASYIRPQALLLAPLFAIVLLRRGTLGWGRAVVFAAVASATIALCVLPWSIRNTRAFGSPTLISTNGAPVTWMGNNPHANGLYVDLPPAVMSLNEAQRAQVLGAQVRAFILHHPARFAELSLIKLVATHDRETIGIVWNEDKLAARLGPHALPALKALSTAYWLAMLLLAVGGAALLARAEGWKALLHPAILLWAYFAAVHAVTLGADRYHFPSVPMIAILAAIAGVRLIELRRRARLRPDA